MSWLGQPKDRNSDEWFTWFDAAMSQVLELLANAIAEEDIDMKIPEGGCMVCGFKPDPNSSRPAHPACGRCAQLVGEIIGHVE